MAEIAYPPAGDIVTGAVDSADLAGFGYRQELHRTIGSYASFATGFSFVSILTTVFQLFAFGFTFGGGAFFWTWPLVFGGQFMVALMFSELASRWPISGAIYQWSSRLGGQLWGWTAGWLMLVAQIVTVSAAAIALQAVLPALWSGFQIIHGDTSPFSPTGAANAVVLGLVLLAFTTAINVSGIRVTSAINVIGVTCELIGVGVLVILLFGHAQRGPSVVLHGTGLGISGFVISGLMAAYVLVGFDSAAELSEETHNPRHVAPRTILRAVAASGVGGALMLLAALMAAPSLTNGRLGIEGISYVVLTQFGGFLGRLVLVNVAIAVTVCTLAIQAATIRMIFSMARDKVLPFSTTLAKVSPRTGTPVVPAVLVGLLSGSVLVINMGEAGLFTTLASVCIMLLYLAYLMVTGPLLLARLRGELYEVENEGDFHLGRWGLPVNVVAVVFGIAMTVNLGWPRSEVFDPAGGHWYLKWFAPLFLAATLAIGAIAYVVQRNQAPRVIVAELEPVEAAVAA
jgi:urea carboxylase system permease